ncbi:MAG TPA: DUF262 domain-containing protein [Chloroflexota bacterium]|nr:DUF262 domain-containing protein [Chloroflexota bacterium]
MPKTDISLGDLVDMIARGELRLPELQRRYVWPATRVRDLLDSLYRGYPSGTILVWETDQDVPEKDLSVAQQQSAFRSHKLLLDGQQRLTSMSAVLRGEPIRPRIVPGRSRSRSTSITPKGHRPTSSRSKTTPRRRMRMRVMKAPRQTLIHGASRSAFSR